MAIRLFTPIAILVGIIISLIGYTSQNFLLYLGIVWIILALIEAIFGYMFARIIGAGAGA